MAERKAILTFTITVFDDDDFDWLTEFHGSPFETGRHALGVIRRELERLEAERANCPMHERVTAEA